MFSSEKVGERRLFGYQQFGHPAGWIAGQLQPWEPYREQEQRKIYDSGINLSIYWMWDAGFDLKLGDESWRLGGEGQVLSVADILFWFQEAIAKGNPTCGTYFRDRRLPGLIGPVSSVVGGLFRKRLARFAG